MTSNHAVKGSRRYRYYATREASQDQPAWRVAAHDLERIVAERFGELLQNSESITALAASIDPQRARQAAAIAATLAGTSRSPRDLDVRSIDLRDERVDILVGERELMTACGVNVPGDREGALTISAPVERIRKGHELRLILGRSAPATVARDDRLVALLGEAMQARALAMSHPELSLNQLAATHGRCRKHLAKLIRLSWLAPEIVDVIVSGQQPGSWTPATLLDAQLPLCWKEQRRSLASA